MYYTKLELVPFLLVVVGLLTFAAANVEMYACVSVYFVITVTNCEYLNMSIIGCEL